MTEANTLIYQNLWWIIPLSLWSLVWKGWALWRAGRLNQSVWFVVMLLLNTLGILEILYIFYFSKLPASSSAKSKK